MVIFHVGQKVCCVNDEWFDKSSPLIKGSIYTVVAITEPALVLCPDGIFNGSSVVLAEAKNPEGPHIGFYPGRFRPVIERKTDISIFTDILKTQRTGVNA